MTKLTKIVIIGGLFLAITGFSQFVWTDDANACGGGWGASGGADYVPQRRTPDGFLAQKPELSETQAKQIVTNYVKRLNPDLEIGKVEDNGNFYAVEVLSAANQVVQILGVDKRSGRLILIN
jgi:hypothetical protein